MATMSAAIAPYGEPLMYCIFFLNVLQHSLTYPLLVAKVRGMVIILQDLQNLKCLNINETLLFYEDVGYQVMERE